LSLAAIDKLNEPSVCHQCLISMAIPLRRAGTQGISGALLLGCLHQKSDEVNEISGCGFGYYFESGHMRYSAGIWLWSGDIFCFGGRL
jgi:hypothetical protein